MNIAYILLGSNVGNRLDQLKLAEEALSDIAGDICDSSSYYETEAWGNEDQPAFINQVLKLRTDLNADRLMSICLTIEIDMGRVRVEKWASRIIDIDILFYNQDIVNKPDLILPHPELHKRMFTLVPLLELDPNYIHPKLNKSITQLQLECEDPLAVKKVTNIISKH